MFQSIREVGIAVASLDQAMETFRSRLGMEPDVIQGDGRAPIQVRTAIYGVGGSGLALMESSEPGSPIDRFLKARGEGLFSVTIQVADVDRTSALLASRGVDLVLKTPIAMDGFKSYDGTHARARMNFTRPRSLCGVVFELQELVD